MKSGRLVLCVGGLLAAALVSPAQQILSHLDSDGGLDVPRPSASLHPATPISKYSSQPVVLQDSALSRESARASFVHSDLNRARLLASRALASHDNNLEALFVRMEVAGMEADPVTMLGFASRLCALGGPDSDDPRVWLAAARIQQNAGNTKAFRSVLPGIQNLLTNASRPWPTLMQALQRGALDGVPGLEPYTLSRNLGILTDWRIVGPLGRHALAGKDPDDISRNQTLSEEFVHGRAVENFQFPDGVIVLPDYLARHGTFYAAAQFAVLEPGLRKLRVDTAAALDIYVDGTLALKAMAAAAESTRSVTLDLAAGPHRILLRFNDPAIRARLWITAVPSKSEWLPSRRGRSAEEVAYLTAAAAYANDDWPKVLELSNTSGPALYMIASAAERLAPGSTEALHRWRELARIAPVALAAREALARYAAIQGDADDASRRASDLLARRPESPVALEILTADAQGDPARLHVLWPAWLTEHPSCTALQQAIAYYRSTQQPQLASGTEQRLNGCAPQSLAHAQALSDQGEHAEAAAALETILSGAPLNRAARFMLLRELQLVGDDAGAQREALNWVHIAPNAGTYRRMAASVARDPQDDMTVSLNSARVPFYLPFRRSAEALLSRIVPLSLGSASLLMEDHVAIARSDGSVAVYVHQVQAAVSDFGAAELENANVPSGGARVLTARVLSPDGSSRPLDSTLPLKRGDALDLEYVINYLGDSGISGHPEVFQHVFGSAEKPLTSQFTVLTPVAETDRGVVIVTGQPPVMSSRIEDGMLARVWEIDSVDPDSTATTSLGIVRVVDQENGWSVPRSAERRKRIETSHHGPRYLDALLFPENAVGDCRTGLSLSQ
jgi:hypothetical protein